MKSYLNLLRQERTSPAWTSRVWNSLLLNRIKGFMWGVYSSALPINDLIQRRGIILALKCSCCIHSQSETLNHLLVQSEVAQLIWSHFARILYRPSHIQDFKLLVNPWLHGVCQVPDGPSNPDRAILWDVGDLEKLLQTQV